MFTANLMAVLLGVVPVAPQAPTRAERVRLARIPEGGIQPQAIVDSNGIELLFFRGAPAAGELFVARSTDGAKSFSAARAVNGATSRAIATGTVRSAKFVLGRGDSLH